LEFGYAMMPEFKYLTDNQIELILDYVDSFEIVDDSDYYAHRQLSKKAMKNAIKAKTRQEKRSWKEFEKALKEL
jgi:hypothetical protein